VKYVKKYKQMKKKVYINKAILFMLAAIFLPVLAGNVLCQQAGNIRISNVSSDISDDSLRIRFSLRVNNLKVGSQESLTLIPRLTDDKAEVMMPVIVFSGRLRSKYDERKKIFSPEPQPSVYQSYTKIKKEKEYRLSYEYSIPYFPRMKPNKLLIEYRLDDCCATYPVREESYALQLQLQLQQLQPTTKPSVARATEKPRQTAQRGLSARQLQGETFHIEYPVNVQRIIPDYGKNRAELRRLDRMLKNYNGTVWVTAYASPEGPHHKNRFIAENRAIGFRDYLSNNYDMASVHVTSVAEDWEGLRACIAGSNIRGRREALQIIDNVDIFAGREKALLELNGGKFWKRLLPYFDGLRRIVVEIEER
jgi:hypothetical protein